MTTVQAQVVGAGGGPMPDARGRSDTPTGAALADVIGAGGGPTPDARRRGDASTAALDVGARSSRDVEVTR